MSQRDAIVAADLEFKPVEWVWRDRIPKGMITVVAGKPDQGKGLFGVHVAAEMTKMGRNVLYSAIEDDAEIMTGPRLEAAGANMDRVLIWRFILPIQFEQLEAKIKEHNISLVVIDPLAAHLAGGISRGSDSIRKVTSPLSELAEHTGVSFLIIEHALKRTSANAEPLAAIGGVSSGLPAAARMAYLFGKDPKDGDRRLLAPVKSNLRERPKTLAFEVDVEYLEKVSHVPYLIEMEETDVDASMLLAKVGDGVPGRPPDKRAAAAEWLTKTLFKHGKPMRAKEVFEDAKQHGGAVSSVKTLRRAADDMGVIKKPPGGGRHVTWELPAPVTKALRNAAKGGK